LGRGERLCFGWGREAGTREGCPYGSYDFGCLGQSGQKVVLLVIDHASVPSYALGLYQCFK
jgi:hypothetical protein